MPDRGSIMSLYNLALEYCEIQDSLVDGEVPDDLLNHLNQLEGTIEQRAERLVLTIQELRRSAEAAKAEAARLNGLCWARDNAADKLQSHLMDIMQIAKLDRITTDLCNVRICKNSRPSIRWTKEPWRIPPDLRKTIDFELDKSKALELWKAKALTGDGFEVKLGSHLRIG